MHAFWVVRCKTEMCTGIDVIKYIGDLKEEFPIHMLPSGFPKWFDLKCTDCGKIHRYTSADVKAGFLETPAPPTFRIDIPAGRAYLATKDEQPV